MTALEEMLEAGAWPVDRIPYCRLVYIAGRYRHYNPDGSYDLDAMAREMKEERLWGIEVFRAGHVPICPLAMTVPLENEIDLTPDELIERECEIVRTLRPHYHVLMLRQGWRALGDRPESVGSRREHETAKECELIIREPAVRRLVVSTLRQLDKRSKEC